jgi:hypothetical protein
LRNPPKKVLGIFPRRKQSSTPSAAKPPSGASTPAARPSMEKTVDEYEDDDLPPREDEIAKVEDVAVANISKTAGFDFKAISEVLGKDIDVDTLPVPRPQPMSATTVEALKKAAPLERSESAPPPTQVKEDEVQLESATSTSPWASSSPSNTTASPPNPSLPSFSNEWSTTPAFPPLRSAPPARPHPPSLMGLNSNNPFGSKREDSDRWATENPW